MPSHSGHTSFLGVISAVISKKTTTAGFETQAVFAKTDTVDLRSLWTAYADCPVATSFLGYLGKIKGKWAITTHIPEDQRNENGSPKTFTVGYYRIPEEYADALDETAENVRLDF